MATRAATPSPPDNPVRVTIDDVDDDCAELVLDDIGIADVVAIAVSIVDAVDIEGCGDARVVVHQLIGGECGSFVMPWLEFLADRAFEDGRAVPLDQSMVRRSEEELGVFRQDGVLRGSALSTPPP